MKSEIEAISLGDENYFSVVTGRPVSPKDDTLWGNSMPWVVPADIPTQQSIARIEQTRKQLSSIGVETQTVRTLPKDSIIILRSGFPHNIGKVAITNVPCCISQYFYGIILLDQKTLIPEFVAYMIAGLRQQITYLAASSKGAMMHLRRAHFSALSLPLLDIETQKEIIKQAHKL